MTNVLEYLEKTVKEIPNKTCYIDDKTSLTFGEVYRNARGIGTYLAKNGIVDKPVCVFMKKGALAVSAFLGTVYGGCYYVPMDSEMPLFRIELIFKVLGDCKIICDSASLPQIEKMGYGSLAVLFEEAAATAPDEALLASIRENQLDTDPIYIVFTSGSTGVPKGVVACHRSVIDYIDNLSEVLCVNEDTVFGNQAPLYTDACLKEIYPTLKFGATAVFIPKMLFSFPVKLIEFLNQHKINTICWVASALSIVSSMGTFDTVKPMYLKTVAFGSEVFPVKQYHLWKDVLPLAQFINLYGPTECTGMSCYFKLDREFEANDIIPIGKPFKNTKIFLLSDDNKEVKQGDVGEICIKGTCLTLGYYKNPEKTNEVFVKNPLNDCFTELIYKTGDLGKFNESNELVFVSRKDFQIKHMGYRVELGEIEAVCSAFDGISLCCAKYNTEKKKILLYYTGTAESNDLLQQLKAKLPRYMLPSELIKLDEMPLTLNGKIDRNQLGKEF